MNNNKVTHEWIVTKNNKSLINNPSKHLTNEKECINKELHDIVYLKLSFVIITRE